MVEFTKKTVGGTSLGAGLRACREERGMTVAELSSATRVQEKFLLAFEADEYRALPETSYQRVFLREIAAVLGIEEGPLLERHGIELSQALGAKTKERPPPRAASRSSFLVAPRIVSATAVLLVSLAAVSGLGFEVWRIVTPPALALTAPADGELSAGPTALVTGTTEREAALRVNGELVYLRPDGTFAEPVNLHRGVNLIKIAAKKPHSDERVLYRRVLWEPAVSGERGVGSGE